MAKGKKTGGKDFAKGWKGGPGRPAIPVEVKALQQITKAELLDLANKIASMDREALKKWLKDNEEGRVGLTVKEWQLIKLIQMTGNQFATEFFFKILGISFPREIDLSSKDGSMSAKPTVVHVRLPSNGRHSKP